MTVLTAIAGLALLLVCFLWFAAICISLPVSAAMAEDGHYLYSVLTLFVAAPILGGMFLAWGIPLVEYAGGLVASVVAA